MAIILATSAFAQELLRGETNDILNILISVQFLKDELDKIAKADEDSDKNENNNIVYFLKIVLKAMTEAMGGVNDFDIFYDDRDDEEDAAGVVVSDGVVGCSSRIASINFGNRRVLATQ